MSVVDISPDDVIRLLQQFLKENKLYNTLKCLQDESSVSLNTVDSVETFVQDITAGRWDIVLRAVKLLKIPDSKLIDLYEQIAIELIEMRETRAANWLIHKTEPMLKLKAENPDRYLHLQGLHGRSFFDPKEAYRRGGTKDLRRSAIAESLKKEVSVVPPQRLLELLGNALKWQKQEGLLPSSSSIDIFTGKAHIVEEQEEACPVVLHKHCIKPITVDEESTISVFCAEFTPDGRYLVVGYSTGLIEFRNPTTGRLSTDLKYQDMNNYRPIVTPTKSAALSISFTSGELLAIGDQRGDISVWKLDNGEIVQLYEAAHNKSVKCVVFHQKGREVLSGGNDKMVRLHSLRSGKVITVFEGHESFVNAVAYSRDHNYILSGSSDSTVRIWNARSAQMLYQYTCPDKVNSLVSMPHLKTDIFLVGNRSRNLPLVDLDGRERTKLSDDKAEIQDNEIRKKGFFSVCSSPKGNYVLAVDSQSINCFAYSGKKLIKRILANEDENTDIIGVRHHPILNLVLTYDTSGNLKLWKP